MKNFLRKFIPKSILSLYHLTLAHVAALVFGHPSEKIIVIGVTGTNGKSTTANLISKILEQAGYQTAVSSTVSIKIANQEYLNPRKITMPGRFFLQRLISQAVKQNCKFAIIESSSEGILQHRQVGIHYDVMVFTNLTPEHIESHGGFENYKAAKLEYFKNLSNTPHKIINGKPIPKIIVANGDNPHSPDFLNFKVDQKITFSKNQISNMSVSEQGIGFNYQGTDFKLRLKGLFDIANALGALATTAALQVDLATAKRALEQVENIPGRMELIEAGQNFKFLVDYAYEPEALTQVYGTIKHWSVKKIIHILGPTGGGRDKARRPVLGRLAAENADVVIITTDDPYDDNPQEIIHQMADGAVAAGKVIKENLFREPDRRKAIAKALSLAQAGDLVLLTGKGAEQTMAIKGGYIPWDDRVVAREELLKLKN